MTDEKDESDNESDAHFRAMMKGARLTVTTGGQPHYRYSREDALKGTYEALVEGEAAFGPHERIMVHRQKMITARLIASYSASVVFVVVAALLIAFAPDSRTMAANVVAGSLLLTAAGLAGFTSFSAKWSGSEIRAETPPNSN